jgi:predicted RNA-binding Zn-ribbon protein involved in translation (DUF1610 family)
MSASPDCPVLERWQALLADTVGPDERESYEQHLESCPACQESLHRAEECEEPLRRMLRRVGDPTAAPADPVLTAVIERLHDCRSPLRAEPVDAADLYFLRPAERPNILGVLGDYEVQEVIGQGGFGIVLKAYEPALHRLVAIKVMALAVAGSATARRRFTREAMAAAAVCHDHIVPVHGVHETDGLPYLVMQYVAGESLQARLDRDGPLELLDVVRIGQQTASGLAAAHAQGLIHRDIKPANLLLENGLARVKITDFGLARMVDDAPLTQNGVLAGTPEYMAPEQARGEVVDVRSDLFSLGSVLYAMCTGGPPFRGVSAVAVLRQVSDEDPAPLRSLNPEVPAWLEALIGRLLAKAPEHRIQKAAEVAALLEGYLAHLLQPVMVAAPELRPLPVLPSKRGAMPRVRQPLIWLAAGMLLVALGMAVGLLLQGGDGRPKQAPEARQDKPHREHVTFDFRNGIENYPALSLQGPPTEELVKTDAQGLRVSIPEGQQDTRPVEVALEHRIHGDFDIVLSYELIAVGKPVPKWGAGVVIRVYFDAPSSPTALISRMKKPSGDSFASHRTRVGPDGKDQYLNNIDVKATGSKGRLRLVRTGPSLQYLVAEDGADFKFMQSVEIGTDDVKDVKVYCHTMYNPISLDARLIELVIDADQFPDGIPAAQTAAAPESAPARREGSWKVVVLGVGSVLAFGAVGVWIYRRRRGQTPTPATADPETPTAVPGLLAVTCSSCGTSLKAKAHLAGKKAKCPKCGQAVAIPGIKAAEKGGNTHIRADSGQP